MSAIEVPEGKLDSATRRAKGAPYARDQIASILSHTESGADGKVSLRKQAREMGVPESTVRHWIRRQKGHNLEPEARAFFESPSGVRYLHRQMNAQLLVFGLMGSCGPSHQRHFLQMMGLDSLVACSDTTLRDRMRKLLEAVANWGAQARAELARTMPRRNVSLGVDETRCSSFFETIARSRVQCSQRVRAIFQSAHSIILLSFIVLRLMSAFSN